MKIVKHNHRVIWHQHPCVMQLRFYLLLLQ